MFKIFIGRRRAGAYKIVQAYLADATAWSSFVASCALNSDESVATYYSPVDPTWRTSPAGGDDTNGSAIYSLVVPGSAGPVLAEGNVVLFNPPQIPTTAPVTSVDGQVGDVNGGDETATSGATWSRLSISETITLSNSSLATDSVADLLPANSIIEAVTANVVVAISGGSNAKGTITLTGQPGEGTRAQGTITLTGIPLANETFVVGAQTFTFKVARVGTGDVAIGIDAAGTVTNIVAAITADLLTVTAAPGAGTTVVVTAAAIGIAGNAILFTESATNTTVDGSGTLGGTTSGTNADTFHVDSRTFTFKATRAGTGDVAEGGSVATTCTNIVNAINADLTTVVASQGAGSTVVVTAVVEGTPGNSITFTESAANLTVDGSGTLATGAPTTGYQVGDPTTATRFAGTISTLTAGPVVPLLAHRQGSVTTDAAGAVQATAAKLRITAVGAPPDAGKVSVTVFYSTFTAPLG